MENVLKDVAEKIKAAPSTGTGNVSKTGHGFSAEDNEACIASFLNIEQLYIDCESEKTRVDNEFAALYGDILDKKGDYKLVDNNFFIAWLASYKEYPSDE